jgi:hypothetical protein
MLRLELAAINVGSGFEPDRPNVGSVFKPDRPNVYY